MYALHHPEYVPERSHVLAVYLVCCWMLCAAVIVGNRFLPHVETLGGVLCMAGFFVSVLVCAIIPGSTGGGHATATAVWKTWSNGTGWSDGLAFCLGMLNGAYAVGFVSPFPPSIPATNPTLAPPTPSPKCAKKSPTPRSTSPKPC